MSNKKINTQKNQKSKKIVSFIAVLFIVGIVGNVALYKYEQHQSASAMHVRQNRQEVFNVVELAPSSSASGTSQNSGTVAQMPLANGGAGSGNSASTPPKLQDGAMLPSDIPPEMLKALEARGMTVEDLQKAGQGGMGAMGGAMGGTMGTETPNTNNPVPGSMGSMGGMGGASQFPEAMQKALTERNAQQSQNSNMPSTSSSPPVRKIGNAEVPTSVQGAIRHIEGHHSQEELSLLYRSLDTLEKNENDINALMNLAGLFANHNEMQAAQFLAQKASASAPSDPDIAYAYGALLNKNFNNEEAVKQWEHALTLRDDAKLRLDLARIYRYQLANAELAKVHLEKALAMPNLDSTLSDQIKKELNQ